MKITFERTQCSRCGGSGHYNYCQMYGTTCFKCAGSGKQLTRNGEAARHTYNEAMSIPASELIPGMAVRVALGLEPVRRHTVEAIGPSDMKATSNGVPLEYLHIDYGDGNGQHVFPDSVMKLALCPATLDRAREAVAGLPGATIIES